MGCLLEGNHVLQVLDLDDNLFIIKEKKNKEKLENDMRTAMNKEQVQVLRLTDKREA